MYKRQVLEKIAPGKKEDETEPEEEVPIVEFDDFLKLRLQIGTVINAESIPKAKKLLKLEVDFGKEQRQIVSGIAKQYQPDELVGKQFVFVTNLKPRKVFGFESQGMILTAQKGEDGLTLLSILDEVEPGAAIS